MISGSKLPLMVAALIKKMANFGSDTELSLLRPAKVGIYNFRRCEVFFFRKGIIDFFVCPAPKTFLFLVILRRVEKNWRTTSEGARCLHSYRRKTCFYKIDKDEMGTKVIRISTKDHFVLGCIAALKETNFCFQ